MSIVFPNLKSRCWIARIVYEANLFRDHSVAPEQSVFWVIPKCKRTSYTQAGVMPFNYSLPLVSVIDLRYDAYALGFIVETECLNPPDFMLNPTVHDSKLYMVYPSLKLWFRSLVIHNVILSIGSLVCHNSPNQPSTLVVNIQPMTMKKASSQSSASCGGTIIPMEPKTVQ